MVADNDATRGQLAIGATFGNDKNGGSGPKVCWNGRSESHDGRSIGYRDLLFLAVVVREIHDLPVNAGHCDLLLQTQEDFDF